MSVRGHGPAGAEKYELARLRELSAFFLDYPITPALQRLHVAMVLIENMRLLHRPEHRYGIAGSIEGALRHHPDERRPFLSRYVRSAQTMVTLRPSDLDHEIANPPAIDYLMMLALVSGDEAPVARVIRLGMRRDPVGDAAVITLHHHAAHPLVVAALVKAQATSTTAPPPSEHIPTESIATLARLAAEHPMWSGAVLCVGWEPRSNTATHRVPGRLVAVTPDGQHPAGFPQEWDGHAVVTRMATADELAERDRMRGEDDRP